MAERLKELLGKPVEFAADCVGPTGVEKQGASQRASAASRKCPLSCRRGSQRSRHFRSSWLRLCDELFVCDAFGSAHRAHASVVGITKFVGQAAAGLLMEKELAYLGKAISNPERPFVAVLGGAKVSDKIEVVQNLMKLADSMLIGGAMAYTFLKSQGLQVGKSLVEDDKLDLARGLLDEARKRKFRLLLPVDHVLAESPDSAETRITDIANTPDGWMGLDIGPKTIELFRQEISKARTIVWNGPLGMFEKPAFARGHAGDGPRRCCRHQSWSHVHCWWRRFRGRRRAIGRRRPDFAHFDGRRRFARISCGRKAPGRRSAHRPTR